MLASFFKVKSPTQKTEDNNIKFGSFDNSYIKDELPTEFTLTNLISLFEKLTDEINRFFNLFDPLFNISEKLIGIFKTINNMQAAYPPSA